MTNNPIMPQRLEQLHLQTPGSRGPDGTLELLKRRDEYYISIGTSLVEIQRSFWVVVEADPHMNPAVSTLSSELSSIDESCIIPNPDSITTPRQCDDLIWKLNSGLARVGRTWTVANTALSLCEYELSVIEKWLRTKFRLEDTRAADSRIGVMLQKEKRHINMLVTLAAHAERVYKRIETQLPSLRDLSERRYQESRYQGDNT